MLFQNIKYRFISLDKHKKEVESFLKNVSCPVKPLQASLKAYISRPETTSDDVNNLLFLYFDRFKRFFSEPVKEFHKNEVLSIEPIITSDLTLQESMYLGTMHPDWLEYLLKKGLDPSATLYSTVMWTSNETILEKLQSIFSYSPDVAFVDSEGFSTLQKLAMKSCSLQFNMLDEVAALLMKNSADPQQKMSYVQSSKHPLELYPALPKEATLLHLVAYGRSSIDSTLKKLIKTFQKYGVDINGVDAEGNPPLAWITPGSEMWEFFQSCGADIHMKNKRDETPEHAYQRIQKIIAANHADIEALSNFT